MKTFVIDSENNITALNADEPIPQTERAATFKSNDELRDLAEGWSATRLVELWNTLARRETKRSGLRLAAQRRGRLAVSAALADHIPTNDLRV